MIGSNTLAAQYAFIQVSDDERIQVYRFTTQGHSIIFVGTNA
jgi:hypothetical protein